MPEKHLRWPRLMEYFDDYLIHARADEFAARVDKVYTQGTLQRLVTHPVAQVRMAAITALGMIGDYDSNHVLGMALLDEMRAIRTAADEAIRRVWMKAGTTQHRRRLAALVRLNTGRHYQAAMQLAAELAHEAPELAEVWHQWATACFYSDRYEEAVRYCHEALELNPYHFAAAALMGQAYLKVSNQVGALDSFRRALRLNPDLEGVRVYVAKLSRIVEGQ